MTTSTMAVVFCDVVSPPRSCASAPWGDWCPGRSGSDQDTNHAVVSGASIQTPDREIVQRNTAATGNDETMTQRRRDRRTDRSSS